METPSYLGPKLWNLVPHKYKTIASLADYKAKIKMCPRKLYLQVMQNTYSPNSFT